MSGDSRIASSVNPEFEIPLRSGDAFCFPPIGQWEALARENAAALDRVPAPLAGLPLAEVRREARAGVLTAAAAYARVLGLPPTLERAGSPLIVTGHQPTFFHPGIWLKHLAVDRVARDAGGIGLSVSVDTDTPQEIGADVPHREGRELHLVHETLLRAGPDIPYEAIDAPSAADWQAFVNRLHAHLDTVPLPEATEALRSFAEAAGTPTREMNFVGFLTAARRRYEGNRPYGEVAVSRLNGGQAFRRFAWHLLCDGAHFAAVYNKHLGSYRARYKVRTSAQPFPDLASDADRQELPFWILSNRVRQPVFVQRRGGTVRLFAGPTHVLDVDARGGPDVLRDIALHGRAFTLTAFSRLCVADLFVHGVGGGRYDRVTDAVIRDYFGIEPPAYAVATATLHLPLQAFDPAAERQTLQRRLLEIQHNPDRLLTHPTPAQQALVDEKQALIVALEGGALSRRDRRGATQRIREINESLARALTAELDDVKERQSEFDRGGEATIAATYREYPFCLFSPHAVDELIEGLLQQGR
ncbi:MAG TPA: hypothetical protein VNA31_06615 [bacterium]|nr:hypothetical protein [bacterium]